MAFLGAEALYFGGDSASKIQGFSPATASLFFLRFEFDSRPISQYESHYEQLADADDSNIRMDYLLLFIFSL